MRKANQSGKRYKIFVETQTRKIISAYGGVGSIFESTKGALIIENFDKWLVNPAEYRRIDDTRLIQRLRHEKAFARLEYLFQVPITNKSTPVYVSASYFPEWFFCSHCERFKTIKEWFKEWKKVQEKYKVTDIDKIKENFVPPKCAYCFDKAETNGEKRRYYELEQVRFIMTSPNGLIQDIPWEYWTNATKGKEKSDLNNEDSENEEKTSSIVFNGKCCNEQDLYYEQSGKFEDLRGISILCKNFAAHNTVKRNTLTGLFGLYIPVKSENHIQNDGTDKKRYFKTVIRSSNSVYYPILINSIYLPKKDKIDAKDKNAIDSYLNNNLNASFIYQALLKKYTLEDIESYISDKSNHIETGYIAEIDYRRMEYQFIFDNKKYSDSNLILKHQSLIPVYEKWGIQSLVKISRLKMTTVQTGYTRQEPLDIDTFLNEGYQDNKIKPQYTSNYGNKTECLPAIESFGEGIFISFDNDKIQQWIEKVEQRVKPVFERSKNADNQFFNNKLLDIKYAAKFMLTHCFSHILIKELEFLCGYPAVSLNERLYIDNQAMQGVLIYTIAGSEGSYGGLINQSEPHKLATIIESALERAKECSSDPICKNAEEQGIGGLNLAACYSCLLLPETSCEELNCFLDRTLLTDFFLTLTKNYVADLKVKRI